MACLIGYLGFPPMPLASFVCTRWACHWTTHLVFVLVAAAMSGLRLQNRFAFLGDQSPRDDDAVARQKQEKRPASSWNDPPSSVEQASTELKASYQRKHRIDTPLGFDDTGKLWQ